MSNDLISYQNGIYAIDSGYVRPRLAAIHLIVSAERVAVVDTATRAALPHALAALTALGLKPESVDLVILTHIHLDHAGGAGVMMEHFPNAKLVVHPRGVQHMIEPSRLMAGVEAVYGRENAQRLYGELVPIPANRIIEAPDNTRLQLGSRELLCLDTPGHARHHIAILDSQTNGMFTGDTFGISYLETNVPGRPLIFPSTTPSQFDPDAMRASISHMLSFHPEAMYLTHFSRVAPPAELGRDMMRRIDAYVAIALGSCDAADKAACIRDALKAFTLTEARAHGCMLGDDEILAVWKPDITLNAQGLAIWANAQA